jgi:hypothetical protein
LPDPALLASLRLAWIDAAGMDADGDALVLVEADPENLNRLAR